MILDTASSPSMPLAFWREKPVPSRRVAAGVGSGRVGACHWWRGSVGGTERMADWLLIGALPRKFENRIRRREVEARRRIE